MESPDTEGEGELELLKVPESTKNPSEETDEYWIWVDNATDVNNKKPDYSKGTTKCGKWLIFQNVSNIDDAWSKIRSATKAGRLGFRAKVSTMKDKETRSENASESVICVYTYNWTDDVDVMRVRKELRELGFTKRIPYKSDEDTLSGNYRAPGKRVSKYFC